jgi:hypothetical protein
MELPFLPIDRPSPALDALQHEIDSHMDAAFLAELNEALATPPAPAEDEPAVA